MLTDLRHAFRLLIKSPGFSTIAIATLALGIGANSAIFSVIDTVLLQPLPFSQPDELTMLWSTPDKGAGRETLSFPDYEDFRQQSKSFSALAAYTQAATALYGSGEVRELRGVAATSDIFPVLHVTPILGRAYTRADDNSDARVVVFTFEAWQRYFNGNPKIIGQQVRLALRPYTVIGVMPRGFRFPIDAKSEYLTPLHPSTPTAWQSRGAHLFRVIGRLQPGVSVPQARAEVAAIAAHLEKQYPDTNSDRSATVVRYLEDLTGNVRPALLVVMSAVFFVLLIACANVANLLLARATARRREIAVRIALGASRTRVIRQLLAEGFLLALLGAVGGLLLAWWSIDLLRMFGPQDVARLDEVRINGVVVLFTLGSAIFSTLIFSLVPALQVTRPNLNASLQEGNRGGASRESQRLRGTLVVSQVALSLLLLAGAGLLIKSFGNLRATNPGFDPTQVMTADFVLPGAKYSEADRQREFFARLIPKLTGLPGLDVVGGASPLPFSGSDSYDTFSIAGRPDPGQGNHADASHIIVTGDYFRAMRIPLLAGRVFDRRDTENSVPAVIVNDTFAKKFFPNENPIGQSIRRDVPGAAPITMEIVGVIGDSRRESLAVAPKPEFCTPLSQDPTRVIHLVVRTSLTNVSSLNSAFRRVIEEMDRDVFVPEFFPLANLIGGTLAQPRFNMVLLGSFAGVAMILAGIGIYGVIAYSVAQRTREIGIRMALGAQRADVVQMILRQSMCVIGIGLGIGLCCAFGLTHWMGSLLYGVSTHDLSIHGLVLVLLGGTGLVASYIPARRAMEVDPMIALRYE